jgi:hypothetical protein
MESDKFFISGIEIALPSPIFGPPNWGRQWRAAVAAARVVKYWAGDSGTTQALGKRWRQKQ